MVSGLDYIVVKHKGAVNLKRLWSDLRFKGVSSIVDSKKHFSYSE